MKFLCLTLCVSVYIRWKTNGSRGKSKSTDSNNKDNDDYDVYNDTELLSLKWTLLKTVNEF